MGLRRYKRHDTAPSPMAYLQTAEGLPVNLTGATILYTLRNAKTKQFKILRRAGTVLDAAKGLVQCDLQPNDTAELGIFEEEWEVTYTNGKKQSFPLMDVQQVVIVPDIDES